LSVRDAGADIVGFGEASPIRPAKALRMAEAIPALSRTGCKKRPVDVDLLDKKRLAERF
jgi:hypothetical protein